MTDGLDLVPRLRLAQDRLCSEAADELVRLRGEVAGLRRQLLFRERAQDALCAVIEEQGEAVELLRRAKGAIQDWELEADIDRVLAGVDRPHDTEGGQ